FQLRPSLKALSEKLFDQLIAIMAGAVIIAYAIYTQWPDTVAKFQTTHLSYTIPFVIFGVFRYLDLVYRQAEGDQPEYILLTDLPLILDILLFGACVWWIIIGNG
ncbi:MAG: decaprenyl-phosphate phosphoribosyltransferase, partial [Lentisphaerae bacterium]|nr:decaprenyl-phosphate phosphoribosyltransferase [Lentisphaerota bacterium]